MAELDRVLGKRRKKRSPPREHPKNTAPVLLSPAHAPSAGTVSHETYQILKWSPFDLVDPLPQDFTQTTPPRRSKAATPEPYQQKRFPPPPKSYTPQPYGGGGGTSFEERRGIPRRTTKQPSRHTAAAAPPLRPLRPLYDVPSPHSQPPPLSSSEQVLYENRETLQQLKQERQKLEQLQRRSKLEGDRMKHERERIRKHELELQHKVDERRVVLEQQREKEQEMELQREAEWARVKQLYTLEVEAESACRDIVITERRERERLEDERRRKEAEIYFKMQERALAAEERERMKQRADLLKKAQDWQRMLAINAIVKEETSQRQLIGMQQQKDFVDIHSQLRYMVTYFSSVFEQMRTEEDREADGRGNIKYEQATELKEILEEHEVVMKEEATLRELERVEFVGRSLESVRKEEDKRMSIEVEERTGRRELTDAFTHEVECFVLKLQEIRSNEHRIQSLLEWEELLEERALILLDEKEDNSLVILQQERWERHKIEEVFFIEGDDLKYTQFMDVIDDLVDEESDIRWKLHKKEEQEQQHLLRWQILMLDETSERIEILDEEEFSRQQLDMIEAMAKRVEQNQERERIHEERLNRLEKLDLALGMSVLNTNQVLQNGNRQSNMPAEKVLAAVTIQKIIRMFLARKHVHYMKRMQSAEAKNEQANWRHSFRKTEKRLSPTKGGSPAKQRNPFPIHQHQLQQQLQFPQYSQYNPTQTGGVNIDAYMALYAAQQQQQQQLAHGSVLYDPYTSSAYLATTTQQQQQPQALQLTTAQQQQQALQLMAYQQLLAQQQQQPQQTILAAVPAGGGQYHNQTQMAPASFTVHPLSHQVQPSYSLSNSALPVQMMQVPQQSFSTTMNTTQ